MCAIKILQIEEYVKNLIFELYFVRTIVKIIAKTENRRHVKHLRTTNNRK